MPNVERTQTKTRRYATNAARQCIDGANRGSAARQGPTGRTRVRRALAALFALAVGLASVPRPATAVFAPHAGPEVRRPMPSRSSARSATRLPGEHPCAVLPPLDPDTLRFGASVATAGPWIAIAAPTEGDDATSPGEVVVGRLVERSRSAPPESGAGRSGATTRTKLHDSGRGVDHAHTDPLGMSSTSPKPRSESSDDECIVLESTARLRSCASLDHFGSSLGLGVLRGERGPTPLLLIGRDQADSGGTTAGAVDIYLHAPRETDGAAESAPWLLEATLTPASPQAGAEFGACVALATGDPSIAVVGAPRTDLSGHFDAGLVEIFRREVTARPDWMPGSTRVHVRGTAFGRSEAVRGSHSASHDDTADGVEIRWRRVASVRSDDPQTSAWFGRAIATDGRWLAVGAPGTDVDFDGSTVFAAGTVFLYRIDPNAIVPVAGIVAPEPTRSMWFGAALAMDQGRLIVGAPGAEIAEGADPEGPRVRAGCAYIFDIAAFAMGSDAAPLVLEPPTIEVGAGFGQSVALAEGLALVGAPGVDGVRIEPDGSWAAIEDSGRGLLFELPWAGAPATHDMGASARILEGPSPLPMSLFATCAAFSVPRADGPVLAIHGHLYVEEESHGPSPGVTVHRAR